MVLPPFARSSARLGVAGGGKGGRGPRERCGGGQFRLPILRFVLYHLETPVVSQPVLFRLCTMANRQKRRLDPVPDPPTESDGAGSDGHDPDDEYMEAQERRINQSDECFRTVIFGQTLHIVMRNKSLSRVKTDDGKTKLWLIHGRNFRTYRRWF